jgi:hypothetical protein
MFVIALTVAYAAACWKWGAWRRWREFYPSILYMVVANLTYAFVFYEYRLWIFSSFMGDTITCLVIKDLAYPSAVILFLTHYPEGAIKQLLYILGWAVVNTGLEYVALILGGIYYEHGWTLLWSFVLIVIAFALVRLHQKKPLLVWIPSIVCGAAFALIFGLPYPR